MKTLDRELVKKAIRECKKAAGLDFAYSAGLSDCMSCTNAVLEQKHGGKAKGIWLKWFRSGMNASKWQNKTICYIVHTLTKEQGKKVVEALSQYFKVNWDGDKYKCIEITPMEAAA